RSCDAARLFVAERILALVWQPVWLQRFEVAHNANGRTGRGDLIAQKKIGHTDGGPCDQRRTSNRTRRGERVKLAWPIHASRTNPNWVRTCGEGPGSHPPCCSGRCR